MFFGFFLSVFYESDSRNSRADWERLISTDCIPLASCSFMPSWSGFRPAEANRFRDTMWMIFHFLSRNFCRWTWRQSRSVRFRVLVLSIIINRQATPELGRGNEWDHTFFNRWLADERPLCLTKAFLLRFINESIPILFREKFAKERKTWMVVQTTNLIGLFTFLLAIFVLKSDSPKTKRKKIKNDDICWWWSLN